MNCFVISQVLWKVQTISPDMCKGVKPTVILTLQGFAWLVPRHFCKSSSCSCGVWRDFLLHNNDEVAGRLQKNLVTTWVSFSHEWQLNLSWYLVNNSRTILKHKNESRYFAISKHKNESRYFVSRTGVGVSKVKGVNPQCNLPSWN